MTSTFFALAGKCPRRGANGRAGSITGCAASRRSLPSKLVRAIEQLLGRLGVPRSIAELGISKEEFEQAMPELTKNAFNDPSWRTNPRMPLISELAELYWSAYRGRSAAQDEAPIQKQKVEQELCV